MVHGVKEMRAKGKKEQLLPNKQLVICRGIVSGVRFGFVQVTVALVFFKST